MPRMLDLLRVSALPSNIVMAASRGSLAVPPREMIEILVHLAVHNKVFGQQAQLTLAGWDEAVSRTVAADPTTPKEVLEYMISPKNLRPVLLPALLSNPSVCEESLIELAGRAPADVAEIMLKSERVERCPKLKEVLQSNPNVIPAPVKEIDPTASVAAPYQPVEPAVATLQEEALPVPDPLIAETRGQEGISDSGILAYLAEHNNEICAEGEKEFQPIGGFYEELVPDAAVQFPVATESNAEAIEANAEAAPATVVTKTSGAGAAAAAKRAPAKKTFLNPNEERGSALQKISRLDIKGRIQLAMKGNKEERSLLIRDGTKVVALAVLESPKITDGEVEKIASQKNVLEAVLRAIPLKRRFAKNYAIMRNLTFNPRTPLDLSLTLVKNLLVNDLRNLAGNKEVSDTLRKLGLKMFKQKIAVRK